METVVAHRDVDPDDDVLTFEQLRELGDIVTLDTDVTDRQHIHPRHLPFHTQQRSRSLGKLMAAAPHSPTSTRGSVR